MIYIIQKNNRLTKFRNKSMKKKCGFILIKDTIYLIIVCKAKDSTIQLISTLLLVIVCNHPIKYYNSLFIYFLSQSVS